ncbi:Voltage gated chloride channel [Alkalibacterium thalassium]|uniref:Voltage gated chloride channel n=1 Tax=Alkalibacterium thalassium TaxID=426701 RepID=A0A1G9CGQ4_9LACT|nr:Voltage gated chloride channel [Alkalibacterium thalassium]
MKTLNLFDWSKIAYVARGLLVGVIVGIVVSLFRVSIETMLTIMRDVYAFAGNNPIWIVPLIVGIAIIAFIIAIMIRDEPDIKGSGIQDIEGQLHGVLKLNWLSILWRKFVGGVLSIGSGLALGREGPSI